MCLAEYIVTHYSLTISNLLQSILDDGLMWKGEGSLHALLIQVLKGYEVNGCPYWSHCDRIVGNL